MKTIAYISPDNTRTFEIKVEGIANKLTDGLEKRIRTAVTGVLKNMHPKQAKAKTQIRNGVGDNASFFLSYQDQIGDIVSTLYSKDNKVKYSRVDDY